MYVNFVFAALFPSPYSRVKKYGKFKTNIHLVSVDSFLYYLSSSNGKVWRTPLTASSTLLKTTWKGPLSHYLTTVQGVNWSNVFSIAFKSKAQFPKYFHRALWWWKQHFFWKWRINMDFSLNELRNNWFQCHKKRCKLDLGSNSNKKLIYTLKKAT